MSKLNTILSKHLGSKDNAHFDFEEEAEDYFVPTGSLRFDDMLGGGLKSGIIRFMGRSNCGKTACACCVMHNFLQEPNRRGLFIDAEGRFDEYMAEMSGLKVVRSEDEWEDGTVYLHRANEYESICRLLTQIFFQSDKQVFVILDSLDTIAPKTDLGKDVGETAKVASKASLTNTLLQRVAIPIRMHGHIFAPINQARADLAEVNKYATAESKRGMSGTGGYAIWHAADVILDFGVYEKILENPSKRYESFVNEYVGHNTKIKIVKSMNEKANTIVRYPVKYGRKGGRSVWIEKEVFDCLKFLGAISNKGAWYSFSESCIDAVKAKYPDLEFKDKFQGEGGVMSALEADPKLCAALSEFIKMRMNPNTDHDF